MKKHLLFLPVFLLFIAGSCQREDLPEMEVFAPEMAIDEALQQYGKEMMRGKEGAILAVDPSTGVVLASIFTTDHADSLKVIELAKKCMAEGFPKASPEEVETMWWDVNGGVGVGARLWVAHVDGLDICGKSVPVSVDESKEAPVFLGFAPREHPRIAILSYIKGRPLAATYSAPIGSLMIEKYLGGETTRPDLERRMKKARPLPQMRVRCGTYFLKKQNEEGN